ncbi:MAG: hypothetical protein ACJ72N_03980 [Labedaea sp.]
MVGFRVVAGVALVAGGMLVDVGRSGADALVAGPACERGEFCSWPRAGTEEP